MSRKFTYEEVKEYIEKIDSRGYKLITSEEEYINTQHKILLVCNNGHLYKIAFANFKYGTSCKICCDIKSSKNQSKSHEQFSKEVFGLVGNEYTVLGEYKNSQTKIKIRHNSCGREYEVIPNAFLKGVRCAFCQHRSYKKITKEFKEEVFNLVGKEYKVLDGYIDAKTKIKMKHNICNNVYKVTPNGFLGGSRCPFCFGNFLKTTEQFKKEIFNLVKEEYIILEEYKNTHSKILIKHTTCGYEYKVTPSDFLQNHRCPKCFGTHLKTTQEFRYEIYNLVKSEYEVLGEYKKNDIKIDILHNLCGYQYKVTPSDFLKGCRCPKCNGKIKKTTEQFKQEIFNLVGDEYSVLGEYKNSQTKIKIRHNSCGCEYEVTPANFLSKHRCPVCNESKGEKRISNYLKYNNIIFKPQYKFDNCKNKRKLPFDFAIFDKNNNFQFLAEYDGLFHYESSRFSKDKNKNLKKFKELQINDFIKSNYCIQNKIYLLRIPYWEYDNIEQILEKELLKYNLLN